MIIRLKKSVLFTIDPDLRFAREHGLSPGALKDIYRRYKLLDYSVKELCDFHEFKTGKKIPVQTISRWLWRAEIYAMTRPILKKGADTVVSSFFKEHEWRVVREITKNLKRSVKNETKTFI